MTTKMDKTVKVIAIILMSVLLLTVASSIVLGVDIDPSTVKPATDSQTAKSINNIVSQIISVVQVIGAAVAVIMLIVLAIKYISAAPNDKAEIKKHAVVYIVGAVILFGAVGLLQIVKTFAGTIQAS